jgi:hypothetical protein
MLWLGGFLALDLTTRTPDALCPPLEEARAAVKARVGEVRGDYHAEFALIRADDGQQKLDLSLREGRDEVLRRELALDAAGCQDAAQAIALVLERYFDAIEQPTQPASSADLELVPERHTTTIVGPGATTIVGPTTRDTAPPAKAAARTYDVGAHAGLLYDHELGLAGTFGATLYPLALHVLPNLSLGVGVELSPFFQRETEVVREQEILAFSVQGAVYLPLTWARAPFRASLGPWAQLRLQRADAPTLQHEQVAYRTVPGFGGLAQLGFTLSPSWSLLAGGAAGSQLRSAASRFVLQRTTGQNEVLVPDAWFGQGQLTLEMKL